MSNKPFWLVVLLLFLFSSCRYQAGSGSQASGTLFAKVVGNDTLLPQASGIVSRSIREEFLRKGEFTLVRSAEDADFLLEVNLSQFDKTPEVFRAEDTLLAAGFDLRLGASVDFYSSRRKTYLLENHFVQANASSLRENRTTQARIRQPSMALARELGLKIALTVSNQSR
jgi:hypothetical protein